MTAWALAGDLRDGLRSRPGRSLLSLFAIAIGCTALALLLSVLSGLQERARQLAQELGANVIAILPEGAEPLRREQADRLRANLPSCVVGAVKQYSVMTRDGLTRLQVMAADDGLIRVRPWQIVEGRFLDAEDRNSRAYRCVISRSLSERMGWRLGQALAVEQELFRVVGIVDPGRFSGDPLQDARLVPGENLVIVPDTIQPYWAPQSPDGTCDAIYIRAPADVDPADIGRRATALMADGAGAAPALSVITPDTLLARIRQWQRSVRFAAGSIAGLCMLLGGITLMTLMIANVQERVTEIGLRRALGASRADIAALFLMEAGLVTVVAGFTGSVTAHAILLVVRGEIGFPVAMNGWTLIAPVLVAVLSGVAFSYAPAVRASRIQPAQALRNE